MRNLKVEITFFTQKVIKVLTYHDGLYPLVLQPAPSA